MRQVTRARAWYIIVSSIVLAGTFQTESARAATCTYETALNGPGSRTSSDAYAIQMVVLAPYGVAHDNTLDRPYICDDGSVRKSKLAKSSISGQHWQHQVGADTYYRFDPHAYTHNYSGQKHWQRTVRRFTDTNPARTAAWYRNGGACSALPRIRDVLLSAGFNLTGNTMYSVLLLTNAPNKFLGCGEKNGKFAMYFRQRSDLSNVRYSCSNVATGGDSFKLHEETHMMYRGDHPCTNCSDLMAEDIPGNIESRTWGLGGYGPLVRIRAYSIEPGKAASYYRC